MLAARVDDKKKISIIDIQEPAPDGKNVIIKVSKVGICGSDVHIWDAGDQFKGLIMGHEFCGTVVDPGALKDILNVDDRVTSIPLSPDLECEYCKKGLINICPGNANSPGVHTDGAFAEYFSSRPDMVRKLPESISDDEAAMIEPAAVCLHVINMAELQKGDKVLIAGAGIIGSMVAAWTKIFGASYVAVTEVNKLRGDKIMQLGDVDELFDGTDPELVAKLVKASGGGFNKFIDCSGTAPAINAGILSLKKRGMVLLVGINLSLVPITTYASVMKEIQFKGCLAYTAEEFETAMKYMSEKKFNSERFVSGTMALKDIGEAFEKLASNQTSDVKILITP